MIKETFGVNDGHTLRGIGSGAVGKISESEHTRLVGNEIRRLLKENGQSVINCTVDKASSTSESLELVVQMANKKELDWFISVHFNAGKGEGVEVYTYKGRQYPDAIGVCKEISKLGFINRGVKEGTGLYVIRKTIAKSMLIEVCFVDSSDADKYLKIGHKKIAEAIVKGILGSIKNPTPAKPNNPTNNPSNSKKELWEVSISGKLVKRLQEAVNDQGFGKIKVDGCFGEETLKCLPIVKIDAQGEFTYCIKQRLRELGYSKWFDNNNKFGNGTKKAVIDFQKKNKLSVDGIVGKNTWKALFKK